MLLLILCAGALAPGAATVWLLRHRRYAWPLALLAGLGVTLSLPFLLLATMFVFPPLGILAGGAALYAAFNALDAGRLTAFTGWTAAALLAFSCAGWAVL
ncbi:hypothetical protein QBA54_07495 [Streptomyces sp. B21-108]|uniref:hypothetical protein n=1 Tax=Streptomyces sp. B21-108 TaxID=3039419 RepID=UPI002FF252DF